MRVMAFVGQPRNISDALQPVRSQQLTLSISYFDKGIIAMSKTNLLGSRPGLLQSAGKIAKSLSLLVASGLMGASALTYAAPSHVSNGRAPEALSTGEAIPFPGGLDGNCSFDVTWTLESGKVKTIYLPGNREINISPNFKVTVARVGYLDKSVTLNVSGAVHAETNGTTATSVVATGRNLLRVPGMGMVLTVGRIDLLLVASGGLQSYQIANPTANHAKIIDVCAMIE